MLGAPSKIQGGDGHQGTQFWFCEGMYPLDGMLSNISNIWYPVDAKMA